MGKISSEVIKLDSTVGGGALPLSQLPSYGVSIAYANLSVEKIETILRKNQTPIIGRIFNNQYVLDVRTLCGEDIDIIVNALCRLGER